jgi:hypothetical protein
LNDWIKGESRKALSFLSKEISQIPKRNFEKGLTEWRKYGILILASIRRCGGMVDTGDLKSPGSNTVPVRVRSPAPIPVKLNIAG